MVSASAPRTVAASRQISPSGRTPSTRARHARAAGDGATAPAEESEEAPREPVVLAADARYFATGKRKSAVARVIIRPGNGSFELNGRSLETFFPRPKHQAVVRQPLEVAGYIGRLDVRREETAGAEDLPQDHVTHAESQRGQVHATQIQEQTLTFAPKVIVVFGVLALTGPWIGHQLLLFTYHLFDRFPMVVR